MLSFLFRIVVNRIAPFRMCPLIENLINLVFGCNKEFYVKNKNVHRFHFYCKIVPTGNIYVTVYLYILVFENIFLFYFTERQAYNLYSLIL